MKRIYTLLRIFLAHAISFSACIYAQTASSPNETPTAVPHTGSSSINVVSYGAKADGVADDTTAINSAMTACTTRAAPNNGCILYFQRNTSASSRSASGFILKGTGGVYVGDKVASYRDRLPDGNFTTEWPYTIENSDESTSDISYDSNKQTGVYNRRFIAGHGIFRFGQGTCIKSPGPPVVIGFCSTKVSSSGSCSCN